MGLRAQRRQSRPQLAVGAQLEPGMLTADGCWSWEVGKVPWDVSGCTAIP